MSIGRPRVTLVTNQSRQNAKPFLGFATVAEAHCRNAAFIS